MQVNLGGIVHLSTVDWKGLSSMVLFLRGCPLRCPHCHNRELQKGENLVELYTIINEIVKVKTVGCPLESGQINLEEAYKRLAAIPSVNAVILSGGEPLVQIDQVIALAHSARGLGLKVGLETCGYYPERLSRLLKNELIDKVFLDVKATLQDPEYEKATGLAEVAPRVLESLRFAMRSEVPFEVRTAVFPEMPLATDLIKIAKTLIELKKEYPKSNMGSMVLHQGRPIDREFEPVQMERIRALSRSVNGLVDVIIRDTTRANLAFNQ
jgi:pyruvate formate lyase activating enzyme